jgi:deazaflavin-dependent oxidoreductase (nitroreductase family)
MTLSIGHPPASATQDPPPSQCPFEAADGGTGHWQGVNVTQAYVEPTPVLGSYAGSGSWPGSCGNRFQPDRRFSSKAASVPAPYLLDLIGMRLIDRVARAAVRVGLGRRSTALIETTGRRSGKSRVTPVTNGLDGDVFWIVTEHGHKANYVRNIEANPRVRVNAGRGWRTGTARIVDDDPEARLAQIVALNPRARANADIVRNTGTENLVIRIDLAE